MSDLGKQIKEKFKFFQVFEKHLLNKNNKKDKIQKIKNKGLEKLTNEYAIKI